MGQRLNLEIHVENQVVENAYYHWSGYTRSALELTRVVIEALSTVSETHPTLRAIRLLESTGAGFASDEREVALAQFPEEENLNFNQVLNRKEGIISITDDGISETRQWEESRVEIHLDEQLVKFNALFTCSENEFYEHYEYTEEEFQELPIHDETIEEFSFDQLDHMEQFVESVIESGFYRYRTPDNQVVFFIE